VANGLAKVDIVNLPSPDQASGSQSWRSRRYCSQRSGSSRKAV
jgi:hypothetical protein